MKRYTCAWWWPPLNFLRWPLPLPPPFFVRPGLRFTFAFLWIFFSPPCAILAAEEDLRSGAEHWSSAPQQQQQQLSGLRGARSV